MPSEYDIIAALIPTPITIGGLCSILGIDSGLTGGALVSLFVVLYALFVNPPRDPVLGPHQ